MATYYVAEGGSAANKAAATSGTYPGGCMNPTVHNGETFSAADELHFSDEGGAIDETIIVPSSGSAGSPIIYKNKSGDSPELTGADDFTSATYKWTASGSGTNEYYCELSGGGDPSITNDPKQLFMDDVRLTVGTMGSLADHEWDYGDNDTLSFSTIYIRDETGDPDTSGVVLEGSVRSKCFTIPSRNYITLDGLVFEKSREDNIELDGTASNITIQNCETNRALWRGITKNSAGASTGVVVDSNIVSYNGGNGVHMRNGTDGWNVKRNTVHHNSQVHDRDGYCAGLKFNFSHNHIIEQNYVHDENDCGIWGDLTNTGVVVKHNYIDTCTKGGLGNAQCIRFERGTSDCFALYNICTNAAHAGIALAANGTVGSVDGAHRNLVYGNVCYNNNANFGISVNGIPGVADSCTDNVIKNNISIEHGRNLRTINGGDNDGTMGSGNVYESNCFDSEFAGFIWWGASAYDTYDAWLAVSSQTDNNIEADPLFTNEGSADFTLAAGSPCIGSGENLGAPYNDALMPSSTWPDGVVTGDQDDY